MCLFLKAVIIDELITTSNHTTTFLRDDDAWDDLLHISSTDLYLKRDSEMQIVGYFFINKGFDLQDIIHIPRKKII